MHHSIAPGVALGCIGIAVLCVSAWLQVNKQDGSGWGLVALLLLISSCSKL